MYGSIELFWNLQLFLFSALQRVLGNALESFFHIGAFLGRGLKVRNVSLRSTPSFSLFLWDLWSSEVCIWKLMLQLRDIPQQWKIMQAHTTRLFPPSTSTLFPIRTNGKFSGSDGLACKRYYTCVTDLPYCEILFTGRWEKAWIFWPGSEILLSSCSDCQMISWSWHHKQEHSNQHPGKKLHQGSETFPVQLYPRSVITHWQEKDRSNWALFSRSSKEGSSHQS